MALKMSNDLRDLIRDTYYPIGTLYTSNKNTNPSTFMGGTWVAVTNDYILNYITSGKGGAYSGTSNSVTSSTTPGNVGGTAITEAQMPSHSHTNAIITKALWSGATNYNTWDTIARAPNNGQNEDKTNYSYNTSTGGNQAHTHTSAAHTHPMTLKKLNMYGWIRTA